MMITDSIKGTRDFLPDDMMIRTWLFEDIFDSSCKKHVFMKYDTPIIERKELYTRKGGDDIIKEMFVFTSEKVDVCLRPELTPSLVRIVSNMRIVDHIKLYNIGQCWRFETVTTERKREHYQLNCDIVSNNKENHVYEELEILSVVVTIFHALQLSNMDVRIKISHRGIIEELLNSFNIEKDDKLIVFNIINKINKIDKNEITEMLLKINNMTMDSIHILFDFLNIKSLDDLLSKSINEKQLSFIKELEELITISYDEIKQYIDIDLSIVRGLSYYNGFIFECYSNVSNRAICGGGRYDGIMEKYGLKKKYQFVGFGMGDVSMIELLRSLHKIPKLERCIDICIITNDKKMFPLMYELANRIRHKNKMVDIYTKSINIKNGFDYANKIHSNHVLFLNVEDPTHIIIKDMKVKSKEDNQVIMNLEDYICSL